MNIKKLIKKMSIEEKLGQMLQLVSFGYLSDVKTAETGLLNDLGLSKNEIYTLGSALNFHDATDVIRIQDQHLKYDRHKIPLLFMLDVIHGFRTIFPIPLALGATFNPDLVESLAAMSALEASVAGVNVTFSPMADLCRDARWGRVMEGTGECPHLNSVMSAAFVKGYQGNFSKDNIAACVKHFAGYGAAADGKEYGAVELSNNALYNYYLPAYKAAVDAGAVMVMTAFNTLNGVPCSSNKYLFNDILHKNWGFEGVVISDYSAVTELVAHGVAADEKEAALKALGVVDIEMMSTAFIKNAKTLISEGKVSEKVIDRSVYKILDLKDKLGLFENPYRNADPNKEKEIHLCKKHRDLARIAAEKSFVLVKNNGLLPLSENDNIALIGPFIYDGTVTGAWSCHGRKSETVTVSQGVYGSAKGKIFEAEGCGSNLTDTDTSGFDKAVESAKLAEKIVLCIGENSETSGESKSRQNLNIPSIQLELAKKLHETGKPIVAVVFGGRPLCLKELEPLVDSILIVFMPGTEAGNAIANVIYGVTNPSGKLPMSYPKSVGQLPIYYNYLNTGRPKKKDDSSFEIFTSSYFEGDNEPMYPFGLGLSYTTFKYSEVRLSNPVMKRKETVTVSVELENTGDVEGEETVMMYIRDVVCSMSRPVKELKAFSKILLNKGETGTVKFTVTEDMLGFYNSHGSFIKESGDFEIIVGNSKAKLNLVE